MTPTPLCPTAVRVHRLHGPRVANSPHLGPGPTDVSQLLVRPTAGLALWRPRLQPLARCEPTGPFLFSGLSRCTYERFCAEDLTKQSESVGKSVNKHTAAVCNHSEANQKVSKL